MKNLKITKYINIDKKQLQVVKNNQRGITLIALAITIIVLLILAGVSVATLTGDNGILGQTSKAKYKTDIANEKEIIERAAITARIINDKLIELTEEIFKNELEKEAGEEKIELSDRSEGFEIWFKETNRYYQVDKNGNIIGILSKEEDKYPGDFTKDKTGKELDGSEENPYEINCIEDLVELSNKSTTGGRKILYINKKFRF